MPKNFGAKKYNNNNLHRNIPKPKKPTEQVSTISSIATSNTNANVTQSIPFAASTPAMFSTSQTPNNSVLEEDFLLVEHEDCVPETEKKSPRL